MLPLGRNGCVGCAGCLLPLALMIMLLLAPLGFGLRHGHRSAQRHPAPAARMAASAPAADVR